MGALLHCLLACLAHMRTWEACLIARATRACATVVQPSLQSLEMAPPFMPEVGGDDDTSCFAMEAESDEEDPEEWREAAKKKIDPSEQGLFEGF